jgi:hypothetical protein
MIGKKESFSMKPMNNFAVLSKHKIIIKKWISGSSLMNLVTSSIEINKAQVN